tara:strand:- start:2887 stop:3813 length:927 start_codon:yes stop_codon:yes gene_type:complete
MDIINLGHTNIPVSTYSIGTATFGDVYGQTSLPELREIVNKSILNGLNYFDTSPYYGNKLSEHNLGLCLEGRARDTFFISTKVGRYGDDIFNFTEEAIVRSLKQSMVRLKVDYVDILYAHDVEFGDIDQIINETLPALQKLKDAGKTRYIGFSCYPLDIMRKIIERSPIQIDVILTYGHGCLINNTLNTIIPFLKLRNIGIVNASPLCMGLISSNAVQEWHPAPYKMRDDIRRVSLDFKALYGLRIETFAIQSVPEMFPDVHTTLVGIKNVAELDTLLDILSDQTQIPSQYYKYVGSRLQHVLNKELS